MAFVDPELEQQPGQQAPVNGPVSAGGAGVGGSTKSSPQTQANTGQNTPAAPASQLSAYLNANGQQANQQAGQIAGTLGTQTQNAVNAIPGAVNIYTGGLNPVATNTDVNNQVENSPSGLTADQQKIYEQELGASSNAPNSANTFEASSGYQDLAGQIQNAVEQANLWNSGNSLPNLTTAIQPFEGANASTGDQTLDAYLVSQTPGAYSQIQQAVAPAAGLNNALTTGTTQADEALQNAITQDQAATTAAQTAANTYGTNLTNYLNSATTAAQTADTQAAADLANNTLTPADDAALGLTAAQGQALLTDYQNATAAQAAATQGLQKSDKLGTGQSGVDLSTYLTGGSPTPQNVATATQYADITALQNMLGANAPVTPLNGATPSGTPGSTFNLTGATTAIQNAQQVATLQQQIEKLEKAGQWWENAYQNGHAGGQTPGQFNNIIAGLDKQIKQLQSQINAIAPGSPKMPMPQYVGGGNAGGGVTWGEVGTQAGNWI